MKRGDEEEFTEFVCACSASLFRTGYLITGDHQRAEDLLQSTLVRLYRRWPGVEAMEWPVGHAHKVLVNEAISWCRRRSSREAPMLVLNEPGWDGGVDDIAEHERVWKALVSLPPRQRAVMVLRYYEDLSEAEIADTLGTAQGTVKSHPHAATHRLAELLGEPTATPARPTEQATVVTLEKRLTRAVHQVADTVNVPELDVAAVRRTARANQRRMLAVAAAAAAGVLVAAASIWVAPRLVAHALQPAWTPREGPRRLGRCVGRQLAVRPGRTRRMGRRRHAARRLAHDADHWPRNRRIVRTGRPHCNQNRLVRQPHHTDSRTTRCDPPRRHHGRVPEVRQSRSPAGRTGPHTGPGRCRREW